MVKLYRILLKGLINKFWSYCHKLGWFPQSKAPWNVPWFHFAIYTAPSIIQIKVMTDENKLEWFPWSKVPWNAPVILGILSFFLFARTFWSYLAGDFSPSLSSYTLQSILPLPSYESRSWLMKVKFSCSAFYVL